MLESIEENSNFTYNDKTQMFQDIHEFFSELSQFNFCTITDPSPEDKILHRSQRIFLLHHPNHTPKFNLKCIYLSILEENLFTLINNSISINMKSKNH